MHFERSGVVATSFEPCVQSRSHIRVSHQELTNLNESPYFGSLFIFSNTIHLVSVFPSYFSDQIIPTIRRVLHRIYMPLGVFTSLFHEILVITSFLFVNFPHGEACLLSSRHQAAYLSAFTAQQISLGQAKSGSRITRLSGTVIWHLL